MRIRTFFAALAMITALALTAILVAQAGGNDTYPGSGFSSCSGFCMSASGLDPTGDYEVHFTYRSDDGTYGRNGSIGYDDQGQPDEYGTVTFAATIDYTERVTRVRPGTLTAWISERNGPWRTPVETEQGPALTVVQLH